MLSCDLKLKSVGQKPYIGFEYSSDAFVFFLGLCSPLLPSVLEYYAGVMLPTVLRFGRYSRFCCFGSEFGGVLVLSGLIISSQK